MHKGREGGGQQEEQGEGGEAKQIYLDFDLDYVGDCDLRVSLLGVPGGVKWVEIGFLFS